MITQEQANAIAEREYPYPIGSMPWYNYNQTRIEVGFLRQAYAKALMDMNPLIEAGDACRSHLSAWDDGGTELSESCKAWDTALSNLTKNIEP